METSPSAYVFRKKSSAEICNTPPSRARMDTRRSESARRAAAPLANYDFDFGLPTRSSSSGSLHAQKQQPQQYQRSPAAAQQPAAAPSWIPKQPSSTSSTTWSPQSLNAPARSMVGDISGKSWGALDTAKKGTSITDKSGIAGGISRGSTPDLFGDLVRGSMGGSSSAPLNKKISQKQPSASLSMENMMSSLPKNVPLKDAAKANAMKNSSDEMGDLMSASGSSLFGATSASANRSSQAQDAWNAFEGIASGRNQSSSSIGSVDPFGDLQGVNSKQSSSTGTATVQDPFAASSNVNVDFFGSFTKSVSDDIFNFAPKTSTTAASNAGLQNQTSTGSSNVDPFAFLNGTKSSTSSNPPLHETAASTDPFHSAPRSSSRTNLAADPFASFVKTSGPSKTEDPLVKMFWSSTKPDSSQNLDSLQDDWGLEAEFEGHEAGTTTELEGLPPPPSGVTASMAKDKGVESYKQGQFADAIKWLSWAENLLENGGSDSTIVEVLSCRASCLKEAGEYKKAIADCTKVIELDQSNTTILLQRALLYESTEKYKLGIADLREVLKIEPQHRVASNTLARLIKLRE